MSNSQRNSTDSSKGLPKTLNANPDEAQSSTRSSKRNSIDHSKGLPKSLNSNSDEAPSSAGGSGTLPIRSPDDNDANSTSEPSPELPLSLGLQSTKQRRLEYLRNGIDADCEVHVPRNMDEVEQGKSVCYKKFRCHRLFLATASEKLEQDVFQNKQWNGVLQINGVSPESVEIFLEYIYTFEVTPLLVDPSIIGDIFILSCAYNLPELLSQFGKQLKHIEWPMERIFPAFNLSFRHNMLDIENACLGKIIENAADLKTEPSLMELKTYAFNYIIQIWMVTESLTTNELIEILQKYQQANDLKFHNTKEFPHFTKIIKYFPNVLLDAEGLICLRNTDE